MIFEFKGAGNGCVMTATDEFDEPLSFTYQDSDDEAASIDRFREFLGLILDNYGPSTSRYSPKRIYIEVRPGDKYEAPEE